MLNRSSIRVVEPPSRHDEGSGAPRESASAWHAHVARIVVAAGAFCFVTSETLPSGLLTLIAAGLGTSFSTTGQLVTAYAVVVVLFSLPMTFATARIPHRTLLTVTLGVFCASTLLAAAAPTFGILMVSRLLSGLSHALFWWLGQQADWRTPFFVLGGASLVLTVAVFVLFPSYPPAHGGPLEYRARTAHASSCSSSVRESPLPGGWPYSPTLPHSSWITRALPTAR